MFCLSFIHTNNDDDDDGDVLLFAPLPLYANACRMPDNVVNAIPIRITIKDDHSKGD